jgi:hypothetical protein
MRVRVGLFCLALSLCGGAASADIAADCSQGMNDELRIAACTEVISAGTSRRTASRALTGVAAPHSWKSEAKTKP